MSDSLPQPGHELAGKVALVTGGARNIGRAIAQALAAGGASVMVNANTSEGAARETVNLIEDTGGEAAYFIADITDPEAVNRLVGETVARFGGLDILVNNAGVRAETPFETMTFAEWRSILSVILDGAFLCSRACVAHMIEAGGGTIINIGGQTGHSGAAHRAHVITAKSGIAGLTKGLAHDLAPHHITVNSVVPGLIDTVRGIPGAPERPASRSAPPPVGRLGRPEEVAAMVRMLCGPGGRYITGQSIHVNGGGLMP
jgi:3-oxoacyl-[acyl-carrier protein] reductase